jgi:protein CpxP
MSQPYLGVLAGAAFALSAAASVAAYAQPNPGPQPRAERHERTMVIRRSDERPDRTEHLRAILQLKPGQEAALTAYIEAMHPKGGHEKMMRMHGEAQAKSTPEKLARMEAGMAEHEAAMKSKIAATRRFYDQLDPAQKRAFDELPLMMGGPMGDMPMMHGMKTMHHPMPPMPAMPPMPPAPPRS